MEEKFDEMISKKDLIKIGFKPHQATMIIAKAKKFLVYNEGIEFYNNRQVSIVPARVIKQLFHINIKK
ncbi:DUF3173 family protein [Enterococcus cecorum]|uniref:DUF3173 family protein n=1 Tax=Enterococcus cecorum TaxID=44008 RepID=UPI000B3E81D5|nr:DUF3173 family protein [Enterococcus cecorum]